MENHQSVAMVTRRCNHPRHRPLYTFPSEHDRLGRRELPPFILPCPSRLPRRAETFAVLAA
jgi:hypothetical protein